MNTFLIFLRDSLQLIMSPTHGWEDISYDDIDLRNLMIYALIPWLLICACTALLGGLYSGNFVWLIQIQHMIVTFLKFFITYFIAGFVFSIYMPSFSGGAAIEKLNSTLILYSIGLLALIDIIKNCMPIDLAMVNFFPLYVLLIMWRGSRYVKVSNGHLHGFVIISFFSVILPPYLFDLLFSIILPA